MYETSNTIPDGYTAERFIQGVPGIYSDVRVKCRLMLHSERYVSSDAISRAKPAESSDIIVKFLCKYLKDWDLKGSDGSTVKIGFDTVRLIQPLLIERLYRVISGLDAGDLDPAKTTTEREVNTALEALLEDKPAAVVEAENDEKN